MAELHGNMLSSYYNTYSGTDTLIFVIFQGCPPVCLGSISTISYSVYRTKQPVINLGRTNINGVTRGARVFAGSIVFTLINQHWVHELQEMDGTRWLGNFAELKSDELPPFDLMVVSATEYGACVAMYIFGVDTTDEGQVVSVNDMFTETTCSFIARDIESFKAGYVTDYNTIRTSDSITVEDTAGTRIVRSARIGDVDYTGGEADKLKKKEKSEVTDYDRNTIRGSTEDIYYDPSISESFTSSSKKLNHDPFKDSMDAAVKQSQKLTGYTRPLTNNDYSPTVGSDVRQAQLYLKALDLLEYASGIYDKDTMDAVKRFQSMNGITPDGVVDAKTWIALFDKAGNSLAGILSDPSNTVGSVVNVSGARVYKNPKILYSDIVFVYPYDTIVEIIDKITGDDGREYYSTKSGFIEVSDIYSYAYDKNTHSFPALKFMDTGYQVLLLQELVVKIYPFIREPGVYNEALRDVIIRIQKEHDISCVEGVMNEETWKVIEVLSGMNITDETFNKVSVLFNAAQGEYSINSSSLGNKAFTDKFNLTITSELPAVITVTSIAYYKDESTETFANEYKTKSMQVLSIPFSDSFSAFAYSIEHSSAPYKVERIVYASNGNAYKWVFYNRGGAS